NSNLKGINSNVWYMQEDSKEWKVGKINAVEYMDKAGMKKATFYKRMREYEEFKSLRLYKWIL
ncbi:hypothetical protein, partial [Bacillus thuringiensis]